MFYLTKVLLSDFPYLKQIWHQNPGSIAAELIIDLHHFVLFYIILILIVVLLLLIGACITCNYNNFIMSDRIFSYFLEFMRNIEFFFWMYGVAEYQPTWMYNLYLKRVIYKNDIEAFCVMFSRVLNTITFHYLVFQHYKNYIYIYCPIFFYYYINIFIFNLLKLLKFKKFLLIFWITIILYSKNNLLFNIYVKAILETYYSYVNNNTDDYNLFHCIYLPDSFLNPFTTEFINFKPGPFFEYYKAVELIINEQFTFPELLFIEPVYTFTEHLYIISTISYYRKITHLWFLELFWTILPSIILLLIAIPSLIVLYILDEPVGYILTIFKVIGHQWYWSYEIADCSFNNFLTKSFSNSINFDSFMIPTSELQNNQLRLLEVDNSLIVPIETPLVFIVTADDVLHSWAIPSLGIKIDAVPGRLNQVYCFILRLGNFYGQCSELCGIHHGFMPIHVIAV